MGMKRAAALVFLWGILVSGLYAQELVMATGLEAFDQPVIVDEAFLEYIWIMDELALQYDLSIKVQGRGFRDAEDPVQNAIVPPSASSNHLVGHAVDINIEYNGVPYNSTKLDDFHNLPQNIKDFINGCKRNGLRWGGDFSVSDPVHFDDDLYHRDRETYNRLYLTFQP
jgi:hypothetical protein